MNDWVAIFALGLASGGLSMLYAIGKALERIAAALERRD